MLSGADIERIKEEILSGDAFSDLKYIKHTMWINSLISGGGDYIYNNINIAKNLFLESEEFIYSMEANNRLKSMYPKLSKEERKAFLDQILPLGGNNDAFTTYFLSGQQTVSATFFNLENDQSIINYVLSSNTIKQKLPNLIKTLFTGSTVYAPTFKKFMDFFKAEDSSEFLKWMLTKDNIAKNWSSIADCKLFGITDSNEHLTFENVTDMFKIVKRSPQIFQKVYDGYLDIKNSTRYWAANKIYPNVTDSNITNEQKIALESQYVVFVRFDKTHNILPDDYCITTSPTHYINLPAGYKNLLFDKNDLNHSFQNLPLAENHKITMGMGNLSISYGQRTALSKQNGYFYATNSPSQYFKPYAEIYKIL